MGTAASPLVDSIGASAVFLPAVHDFGKAFLFFDYFDLIWVVFRPADHSDLEIVAFPLFDQVEAAAAFLYSDKVFQPADHFYPVFAAFLLVDHSDLATVVFPFFDYLYFDMAFLFLYYHGSVHLYFVALMFLCPGFFVCMFPEPPGAHD